jgi:hypothetical protein
MPTPIADLTELAHAVWAALRSPLVDSFLCDWPSIPRLAPVEPAALPVLRRLATIAAAVPRVAPELVAALLRSASTLAWRQTYTARELSQDFLDDYGYTEILGLHGPHCCDRLACGFLLLGPGTLYPHHWHAAEEIYLPLFGRAEWQQADRIWRAHDPGTLIHHRSEEPHAMRTGAPPLLALYLWRGTDLAQRSRLSD